MITPTTLWVKAIATPFRILAIGLFFLGIPLVSQASHIVGGEIGYRCLGNDQYEVTLTVYRDCFNGSDDAQFDDPAFVGVFDLATGRYQRNPLEIEFMGDDTLTNRIIRDDCLMIPENVCVHAATYVDTIQLIGNGAGYRFDYQRCCRNRTISNIVNPQLTGATYTVELTPRAMELCNSTPVYVNRPPIYICVGKPIFDDHSAIDADGDSLVYRLCTPSDGATEEEARPRLPEPFDTVVWVAPTYNLNNLLGAGRPLEIGETDGRLFGRPDVQGQFVVGVCVEEYRNGELLSVVRRDFQYNVGTCRETQAEIIALETQCGDDFTVSFGNGSREAASYLWEFGAVDANGDSTSMEELPLFTYPDTGCYMVRLTADPGSACEDVTLHEICIRENPLVPAFDVELFDCGDTTVVLLFDETTTTNEDVGINFWSWELDVGGAVLTSEEQNPSFIIPNDTVSMAEVNLVIQDFNGCTDFIKLPIEIGDNDPRTIIPDTLTLCAGDTIQLNPAADTTSQLRYSWRGGPIIGSSTVENPLVSPNRDTTVYTVRIFPPSAPCEVTKNVVVIVIEAPAITSVDAVADCFEGLKINFTAEIEEVDSIFWNFGDTLNNQGFVEGGRTPSYTYPDTGIYEVKIVPFRGTCRDTLTRFVRLEDRDPAALVNIDVGPDIESCENEITLLARSTNAIRVRWLSSMGDSIGNQDELIVPLMGETFYVFEAEGVTGCVLRDTVLITGQAINVEFPPTDYCLGDSIDLTINNLTLDSTLTFLWEPQDSILSGADTNSPQIATDRAGERFFTVFMSNDFGCADTAEVRVTIIDPNQALTFEQNLQCDGTSIEFVNTTPIQYSRYHWIFGDANNSSEITGDSTVLFNYGDQGLFTACLTLDYTAACIDTTCQDVETVSPLLIADFGFEIVECAADSTVIQFTDLSTHNFNSVNYEWMIGDSTYTEQNPRVTFTESERLNVQFVLKVDDECASPVTREIPIPVANLSLDSLIRICEGNPVTLNPGGSMDFLYTWSPADGLDNPSASSPVANPTETTTYTVLLERPNDEACRIEGTTTVQVSDSFDFGIPDQLSTCGEDLVLTVPVADNVDVIWTELETGDTTRNDTIVIPGTYEGMYRVEALDSTGCSGAQSITFINNRVNILEPIGDTILTCEGQSVLIILENPDNQALQINWHPEEYIRSDNGTLRPTFFLPFDFVGLDTTVTLRYDAENEFGCMLADSLQVKVREFEINLPDTANVCPGSPSTVNPNFNPNYTYLWSPSTGLSDPNIGNPEITLTEPMTYTVSIAVGREAGACQDEREISIGLGSSLATETTDIEQCEPEEATLTASVDRENATFEWSRSIDFDEIIGMDSTITVLPSIGVENYYVRVTDNGGCATIDTAIVTSLPIQVSLPDTTNACFGQMITLMPINIDPLQQLDYEWSPADRIVSGQGTANPVFDINGNMLITATVMNQFGCIGEISTFVAFVDLNADDVDVTASPEIIFPGQQSNLEVFIRGEFDYRWLPAETLDDPTSRTPIASPTETTTYTVEIISGDCSGRQDITVTVSEGICEEPFIFVPAAFTPNGDGRNDVLFVRGNAIETVLLVVYNRWGEKVFETENKDIGWDGTFKGKELPSDVYGYYLQAVCFDGTEFEKSGDVTILK